jgi:manganese/zinc/iron transport system permease protein
MASAALGYDGRWLPGLMAGAALTAALGLWVLARWSRRLPVDAATAAVLSVFYGAGLVVLTIVQSAGIGRPAGIEGVLLGQASGMLTADAVTVAVLSAMTLAATAAMGRAFAQVAFDESHARMMGLNIRLVDAALLTLVLCVVLVGLRVVGLILIVALLVTPAATARLWAGRVVPMAVGAALVGGSAGYLGTALSASAPDLPTGPVIILLAASAFAASLVLAPRGVLRRG